MSQVGPGTNPPSLVDLAVEPIRLATGIAAATNATDLRQRAEGALAVFAAEAARAGFDQAAADDARYALVALLDERAMAPASPLRAGWLDRPLQLALFDSFSAGEEFYRRLERWRRPRRGADAAVLEVFHTCLALGFAGMHAGEEGAPTRRQLLETCAGEILAARGSVRAVAAEPVAAPAMTAVDPWRWRGLPIWLVPLLCAVGVLLLWLAGRWWALAAAASLAEGLR